MDTFFTEIESCDYSVLTTQLSVCWLLASSTLSISISTTPSASLRSSVSKEVTHQQLFELHRNVFQETCRLLFFSKVLCTHHECLQRDSLGLFSHRTPALEMKQLWVLMILVRCQFDHLSSWVDGFWLTSGNWWHNIHKPGDLLKWHWSHEGLCSRKSSEVDENMKNKVALSVKITLSQPLSIQKPTMCVRVTPPGNRSVCGRLMPIWSLEMFSHPAPLWLYPRDASLTHCGLCHHFLPAVYSHNFLQHPITWSPDDLTATVSSTTSSDTSYAHTPCAPVTCRACVERVRTNNCLLFASARQATCMTCKRAYWGRSF